MSAVNKMSYNTTAIEKNKLVTKRNTTTIENFNTLQNNTFKEKIANNNNETETINLNLEEDNILKKKSKLLIKQNSSILTTSTGKEMKISLCSASDFRVEKVLEKETEKKQQSSILEKIQDSISNLLKILDITTEEQKAYENFLKKYNVIIPIEKIKDVHETNNEVFIYLENGSSIVLDKDGTITRIKTNEGNYLFYPDGSISFISFKGYYKDGINLSFDEEGNIITGYYTDENGNQEPIDIFSEYNRLAEQYGGNQGSFTRNIEELLEDPIVLEKLRNTYPNATMKDYENYLKRINQVGCGYTAMINTLFEYYKGREREFYNKFGFPMYDIESNGFLDYNYEYLILDFFNYIWGNSGYTIQELYGNIGGVVYDAALDEYKTNQTAKAEGTSIKEKYLFKDFLNKFYGINCSVESQYDPYEEMDEEKIIELYKELSKDPNAQIIISARMFELYDRNGELDNTDVGSHAMYVTGINEDGKLIVSTWGKEKILDLSDADDSYTYFTVVKYE